MTIKVTDNTFAKDVLEAKGPVLVDLWAGWCAPCLAIAPILDELERDFGDRLTIAKVNVDENQRTAMQLQVRSIPSLVLFVDGKIVETTIGVQPKAALAAMIERHLPVAA